jgi:Flp pilus assembly protein TadD
MQRLVGAGCCAHCKRTAYRRTGACADRSAPAPNDARAYYNLGKTYNELLRHAEAETALRRAIALDQAMAPAHYPRGLSRHAQGIDEEAESSYRTAFALNPADAQAHNNLGIALNEQSRHAPLTLHN